MEVKQEAVDDEQRLTAYDEEPQVSSVFFTSTHSGFCALFTLLLLLLDDSMHKATSVTDCRFPDHVIHC